jgi:serine/threonine protein kinase
MSNARAALAREAANIMSLAGLRAEKVGQGAYGVVFRVEGDVTAWARRHKGNVDPMPSVVAVKIQRVSTAAFDESKIHYDISNQQMKEGVMRVVPHLYADFVVETVVQNERVPFVVTCMDYVDCVPLWKRHREQPFERKDFLRVVDLLKRLWRMGYMHGDAHTTNIVIDTKTDEPLLLDVGLATRIERPFNVDSSYDLDKEAFSLQAADNMQALLRNNATQQRKSNVVMLYALRNKQGQVLPQPEPSQTHPRPHPRSQRMQRMQQSVQDPWGQTDGMNTSPGTPNRRIFKAQTHVKSLWDD